MYMCRYMFFSHSLADRALPPTEDTDPTKTLQPEEYVPEVSKVTEDTLAVSYVGMGLNPKPISDQFITGLTCPETGFSVSTEKDKTSTMSFVDGGEIDIPAVEGLATTEKTVCSGEKEEACLVESVLNDTGSGGDRQLLPTCVDLSMEMAVERKSVRDEVGEGVRRRKDGEGDLERERKEETNYDQCSDENGGRSSKSGSTFPYSLPLPVRS